MQQQQQQQWQQEEEDGDEDLGLELDKSEKSSRTCPLPTTTQVMAVEECLSVGIPLNALGNPMFRDFLHHVGAKLQGANHLSNHIPFIDKKEVRTF